jgi:hypothetical protein
MLRRNHNPVNDDALWDANESKVSDFERHEVGSSLLA